ncbi:MAG: GNAT family N-acetyltransferase [Bacteroidia bacterium]|nr:GNAT family N-acetyltransferase [Bacteroidia bacterium]
MVEYYFPQSLSASRLDRYLAGGWFRSGPSLFRAQILCLDGGAYSVINIRTRLEKFTFSKSLRKILKKNDAKFRYEVGLATVDPLKEQLYTFQKGRFKGYIFDTLEEFLFSGDSNSIFQTREIRVYDGDKLVAASYFDLGQKSVASLIGLYDPAYKKYSLGVYTMALEIRYAMETDLKYYYPGYVLKGFTGFDYKLRLGNIQYYNWNGRWLGIDKLKKEKFALAEIKNRILQMEIYLRAEEIAYKKLHYPFFSIGYLDMLDEEFLKSVIFLSLNAAYSPYDPERQLVVEYSLEEKVYYVSWVRTNEDYEEFLNAEFSENFFNEKVFDKGLLVKEETLFADKNPKRIIEKIRHYLWEKPGSMMA